MSSRPPAGQLGASQAATPDATPSGHGGAHPTPAGEEISAIRRRQADLLARRAEADRQLDEAEQEDLSAVDYLDTSYWDIYSKATRWSTPHPAVAS
jgi:hypothetical protein